MNGRVGNNAMASCLLEKVDHSRGRVPRRHGHELTEFRQTFIAWLVACEPLTTIPAFAIPAQIAPYKIVSVCMSSPTTSPSGPALRGRRMWATRCMASLNSWLVTPWVPSGETEDGQRKQRRSGLCSACHSMKPGRIVRDPSKGGKRGNFVCMLASKSGSRASTGT